MNIRRTRKRILKTLKRIYRHYGLEGVARNIELNIGSGTISLLELNIAKEVYRQMESMA